MGLLREIIVSMRPRQWMKNLFVLAALVFSRHVTESAFVLKGAFAFFVFCGLSSGAYLINDVLDRRRDACHPLKRNRPVAAGRLPTGVAAASGVFVSVMSAGLAFLAGRGFGWVACGYLSVSLAYSLALKRIVIVDVMVIALGFLLRAVGGAVAIGVAISSWFVLCTVMISLFLGFVKRRHELSVLDAGAVSHRQALQDYSIGFLDQMIAVTTSSSLVCYALYATSQEVVDKTGTHRLDLTIPFVLYGILRYLYIAYGKGGGGSPASDLLDDMPLVIDLVLWILIAGCVLYLKPA